MQKSFFIGAMVLTVTCLRLLSVGEAGEEVEKKMPGHFIGVWVERDIQGKEPDRLKISEERIVWQRNGQQTVIIEGKDVSLSKDGSGLTFSLDFLDIQGVDLACKKKGVKAHLALTSGSDDLLVDVDIQGPGW